MTDYPARKRLRLERFDYSGYGYYFVTICTKGKQHLFGHIVGNRLDRSVLQPSPLGSLVEQHLLQIPSHFPQVSIDHYVIMPNHIHAILVLDAAACTERSRPFPTLSTVVGLYKSGVSRAAGFPVWQKSFYDHIIRNEVDYKTIWNYIDTNPDRWTLDKYYEQA